MEKIAISAIHFHKNPTGLAVYTYELLCELLKAKSNFDISVYSNSYDLYRLYPDKVVFVKPLVSLDLGFNRNLIRLIWEQTLLPYKARNASLLYSPIPEGVLKFNKKQVITIHDVLPLKYPEIYPRMKYYFRYVLPILLRSSSTIICVSSNTKNDIIEYYKIKDKPIYVVHNGINLQRFYPRKEKRIIYEKYLFYLGDMRPYKNLEMAIRAFVILGLKDIKFIIGGRKDSKFYPKIEKMVNDLSLNDRVIFLDYVPSDLLPYLYSEASAFLFPSFYEGFGFPPLEAMACGCPVIVSNAASLPEVCGDAAYYVDPYNPEDIAKGIYKVLTDKDLQNSLRQKGLQRAKMFSWEKTAGEILNVFGDILR
ncbi:MAG: glycosyltransferase family 1 protein [bacterium]